MTIENASKEIGRLEEFFEVLSETHASYAEWKALVSSKRVSGAQVHDARLAAVMKVNNVAKIVTFNVQDFARFDEIQAVHPDDVL